MMIRFKIILLSASLLLAVLGQAAVAQDKKDSPELGQPQQPIVSPEVSPDRKLTFRYRGASADKVRLEIKDIPNFGRPRMTKGEDGVWTLTVGPLDPGAYLYNFIVDGIRVIDPLNPETSETMSETFSLAVIPGSDLFDPRNVPHGSVARVTYYSKSLRRQQRMHVYTPPGYESGKDKFPVLFLLHGASGSDDTWSKVGRAGLIIDNLIADGKAPAMIVVMPNGHTRQEGFGMQGSFERQLAEFVEDFVSDLKPYVETNYRVLDGSSNRAIAGLSMGGAQTLEIALRRPREYAYVGVFSGGIFSIKSGGLTVPVQDWEERHDRELNDEEGKKGLKLIWFATGKDDFIIDISRRTVEMLRAHGFQVDYKETDGEHTWQNWRNYLGEFLQLLFR